MLNIMIPSSAQVITIVRMFFFFIIINALSPYLNAYIVSVLRSLFISHILVFLVLIIQHIVSTIYSFGAKCRFQGVKCMLEVKNVQKSPYGLFLLCIAFLFKTILHNLIKYNSTHFAFQLMRSFLLLKP